jgi:hypothetical protein
MDMVSYQPSICGSVLESAAVDMSSSRRIVRLGGACLSRLDPSTPDALGAIDHCCSNWPAAIVRSSVSDSASTTQHRRQPPYQVISNADTTQSLAYPLYFASRGRGTVDGQPYQVDAKVYFSGLGPDE